MTAPGEGLDRRTLVVAGVVIVGMIMSVLDTTIVNVALDKLSQDLDSPLGTIQWVSTGYLLALAMVIPLAGWLSERFGSKRVWMMSVALFGAGSALCGLAWSDVSLIAFRILQGFGGGLIMPVGQSVLAQTAGPRHMGRVMSVIGVPILLAPILGPVIGGVIVDSASWRWLFFVNVPIAVAALALARPILDGNLGRAEAGRFDWVGVTLLSPGLAAIVFGLSQMESSGGIGAPSAVGPIGAGALLVALFVRHAVRADRPLVDPRLFRSREFRAAAATTFLLGAGLFGAMLVLPLYYQVGRGEAALTAGLLIAPQGIGAALMMPFSGRLVDRIGGGPVAVVGCTIMTLGTVPLAFVGANTSFALLAAVLVVRGLGLGAAMMPAMAAAYAPLDSAQVPRASGVLTGLQRIGGAVGTALLAVILEQQTRTAVGSAAGGSTGLQPVSPSVREQLAGPLATAFGHTFVWAAAMTAVAILPAALLARAEWSSRAARPPSGAPAARAALKP